MLRDSMLCLRCQIPKHSTASNGCLEVKRYMVGPERYYGVEEDLRVSGIVKKWYKMKIGMARKKKELYITVFG